MFTSRTPKAFTSVALLSTALMLLSVLAGCAPDEQNPVKATVKEAQPETHGDDIQIKQLIDAVEQAVKDGRNPEIDFQIRSLLNKIKQKTGTNSIDPNALTLIYPTPKTTTSFCPGIVSWTTVPGDKNGDGDVEMFELIDYINKWHLGNVRRDDVITAIALWKGQRWSINIEAAWIVFKGPKERGVAQLFFTDDTMNNICRCSCYYAQWIINIAQWNGYTVIKSRENMATEIFAHIELYRSFCEGVHSNPIDIELYTSDWVNLPPVDLPWEGFIDCERGTPSCCPNCL